MGDVRDNIELIAHRNPGLATDWRIRLHHGARGIDEESPRIPDAVFQQLRAAPGPRAVEAQLRQTDWAEIWDWLSPEARAELLEMISGD